MSRGKETSIFTGVILAFAVLIFAALLLLGSVAEQGKKVAWVGHTRDVLEKINEVVTYLSDAENGRRGFVLSGSDRYIGHHTNRIGRAEQALRDLRELTKDSPSQLAACNQLEELIRKRLTISTNSIRARREGGLEIFQQTTFMEEGQRAMDPIRKLAEQMITEEKERLKERQAIQDKNIEGTKAFAVLVSICALMLFSVLVVLFAIANRKRHRAEQALQHSNQVLEQRVLDRTAELQKATERVTWLASFPERNPNPVIEVGFTDGHVHYVNPATVRLFPDLERTGLEHPLLAGLRDAAVPLLARQEPAVRREVTIGDACYAQTINLIPEGQRLRVYNVDITDRKRVQADLDRQRAELQLIFDTVPALIFFKDHHHRLMRANRELCRLLELPKDRVEGRTDIELGTPHAEKYYQDEDDVMATGQAKRDIIEPLQTASGTRWLQTDKIPYRDSEGKIIGVVGFAVDITERKEAEEKILRLNSELEDRVRERTAQLEVANRELESFSYSVSHDLRAPLRHIHGYVELLKRDTDGQLAENCRRYLETISAASVEMGQLIDDLLSFSRVGRVELRERPVNVRDLVDSTIKGLEMSIRGRKIVWRIGDLPMVLGDAATLKQVFANLIGNAVKYTRNCKSAEIEIGCNGEKEGQVVLFVRDNGAGFDMQYAQKLFGVFQRLHRADQFEGTGIGLATVRRIVQRHGGQTWAEGETDKGATFYFALKPARKGRAA